MLKPYPANCSIRSKIFSAFFCGWPCVRRALEETAALRGHLLHLLLAHGAAQNIGIAQRVTGDAVRDLHHLFLVDHHAVGLLEDLLHLRQIVDNFPAAVFALDEVVDHAALYGAGTVERVQRGQVFDAAGLVAAQNVAHARRFELEHAAGEAFEKIS